MTRTASSTRLRAYIAAMLTALVALAACSGPQSDPNHVPSLASLERPDGLDPATVPVALRERYSIFADRCSRCHTLARPLNSDFSTMEQWRNYVRRMRRQPGSGISPDDESTILVFLQWFNDQRNVERARSSNP